MSPAPSPNARPEGVALDGHVHLYPVADFGRALSAGYDNLARSAGPKDAQPCVMLTETIRDHAFASLCAGDATADGWRMEHLPDDPAALRAHRDRDGACLVIVAGRQIVTRERIEVLAYGTTRRFEDGLPTADVLADLKGTNTPAALPWGLGKWIGPRGKHVAQVLDPTPGSPGPMLGDNAGRPYGWPEPPLFRKAKALGRPVVPGSDPLPLPNAEADIGRFGAFLDVSLAPNAPSATLRDALLAPGVALIPIGRRQSILEVIKWQRAYRSSAR